MASYWDKFTTNRMNRRRLLKSGASLSLGASALYLAGCGGDDDDDGGGGTSTGNGGGSPSASPTSGTSGGASGGAGQPVKGGVFTYGLQTNPVSSHNILTDVPAGHSLGGLHVYDHLIATRVREGAPYVLEAAESVETPDQLTVIFKMHPGMVYQDVDPVNGREVKASDIAAFHLRVRDTAGANRSFEQNSMESVEAPDDLTVVFKLQRPNAYLFTGTQIGEPAAGCIVPIEIQDKLAEHQAIGSGPYREARAELNVRYDYVRNETYRKNDQLMIDERQITVFNDVVGAEANFVSGQSLIYDPDPGDPNVEGIESTLGDKIYKQEFPSFSPFTVNIGGLKEFNPLKRDERAREGVYRALDRSQYIELIFGGKGVEPPGLLTLGFEDYQVDPSQTEESFRQDVAEARKLFEAAGVTDQEFEIMYFAPGNQAAQSSEIFKRQLGEAGLQTIIRGVPTAEGFQIAESGRWHLFTGPHPEYASPELIMRQQHTHSGSRFANTGLEDPEIDALIEKAEQALDYEENTRLVKEIQVECIKRFGGYILLVSRIREQLLYNTVQNWTNDGTRTWQPRIEAWLKPA